MQLTAQRIAALCGKTARPLTIEVVAETGSTNADLLARVGQLSSATLLIAETQTAGRGRAGRHWLSEPGASLTFSLAWKFQCPLAHLTGLPLAVGVVMAEVFQQLGVEVQLKWPNDVLKDGKKLAGILVETRWPDPPATDAVWAVIGIGLNLAMPRRLAARIGQPATAVSLGDRQALLATLVQGLSEAAILFEQQGFAAFQARWNRWHAYAGQAVTIFDHGQIMHQGMAAGVDSAGRLLLDTDAGRLAIMAGDVSLQVKKD